MTSESTSTSERFSSSKLSGLATAAEARSKPIRYKTKSFSIRRESCENESECLVLEANTLASRSTNVRLQVWPDGGFWFGAFARSKSGWEFQLAFTGLLGTMSADAVIETFEQSIGQDFEPSCADETKRKILAIWDFAEPAVQGAS